MSFSGPWNKWWQTSSGMNPIPFDSLAEGSLEFHCDEATRLGCDPNRDPMSGKWTVLTNEGYGSYKSRAVCEATLREASYSVGIDGLPVLVASPHWRSLRSAHRG